MDKIEVVLVKILWRNFLSFTCGNSIFQYFLEPKEAQIDSFYKEPVTTYPSNLLYTRTTAEQVNFANSQASKI